MDTLPMELLDNILVMVIQSRINSRNEHLALRRVCRAFDRVVAPMVLNTLQLNFFGLERLCQVTGISALFPEDLRCRGHLIKALCVDTLLVRDQQDLEHLVREATPIMSRFQLNCDTFNIEQFRDKLHQVIQFIPQLRAFRLKLPLQFLTRNEHASCTPIMILSNSLAVLAEYMSRQEENGQSPLPLDSLVLEQVPEGAIRVLWNNPMDIKNIMTIFSRLRRIVFELTQHVTWDPSGVTQQDIGLLIWKMLGMSKTIETVCVMMPGYEAGTLCYNQTVVTDMTRFRREQPMTFPIPDAMPNSDPLGNPFWCRSLRVLEFKRVELNGPRWMKLMNWLPKLEELYLYDVFLQTFHTAEGSCKTMWIGLPNRHPDPNDCWIAPRLRERKPPLRVFEAVKIAYNHIVEPGLTLQLSYDIRDPSSLMRTLDKRLVDEVMGATATATPSTTIIPSMILPIVSGSGSVDTTTADQQHLAAETSAPGSRMQWTLPPERPAHCKKLDSHSPSLQLQRSVGGGFVASNMATLHELQNMAECMCRNLSAPLPVPPTISNALNKIGLLLNEISEE